MTKIIFLTGAPGTGKSTISKILHKKLRNSALVELSWIRCYHLDDRWSNASDKEVQMSFENLIFIINNYIKYDYSYVIVNDLLGDQIDQLSSIFKSNSYYNFSLYVKDDIELQNRVLNDSRDSGYRDYKAALEWNKELMKRDSYANEIKVDNSSDNPDEVVGFILENILGNINQNRD